MAELAREARFADVLAPPANPTASPHWRERLPSFDSRQVGAVFVGGALGTLCRAALSESFRRPAGTWPWPTFVVNMAAALLLGYFVTRLQERLPLSSFRRPFLGTGVCGGLSTFSTMQVELYQMVRAHYWALAGEYLVASVVGGLVAISLASALVRKVRTWR